MSVLQDLVGKSDPAAVEKAARIERASHDYAYFCKTYLGHYFTCSAAPYQEQIYKVINERRVSAETASVFRSWTRTQFHKYVKPTEGLRGIIDMEPRDHGKSVRMTLAYPLWCALFKKARFIALFGATDDSAKGFLENITWELESNELLLADFGDLKGDHWGSNKITLKNGVAITTKGKGASARGLRHHESRPDLIIIDDLLKDSEAESPDQCAKAYAWIKRVAFNLGKDSFIVMVNTHFNEHDPITLIQGEVLSGKLTGFLALRFSAQLEDGRPIWESRWSKEALQQKRNDIGSDIFDVEYNSLTVNSEGRIFEPLWFQYFNMADIDLSTRIITMGVDPNATGADDAAIAVNAYDPVKKLRDIVAWWAKPYGTRREFVDRLIDMFLIWRPTLIGFEEVAFQKIYKEFILEAALERGVMLPIVGIKPGSSSKKSRVMQYQPYVEAGIMRFNQALKGSEEMDRLQAFPTKGINDGIPDAIYYAVMGTSGPMTPTGAAAAKKTSRTKELLRRYIYG